MASGRVAPTARGGGEGQGERVSSSCETSLLELLVDGNVYSSQPNLAHRPA